MRRPGSFLFIISHHCIISRYRRADSPCKKVFYKLLKLLRDLRIHGQIARKYASRMKGVPL